MEVEALRTAVGKLVVSNGEIARIISSSGGIDVSLERGRTLFITGRVDKNFGDLEDTQKWRRRSLQLMVMHTLRKGDEDTLASLMRLQVMTVMCL